MPAKLELTIVDLASTDPASVALLLGASLPYLESILDQAAEHGARFVLGYNGLDLVPRPFFDGLLWPVDEDELASNVEELRDQAAGEEIGEWTSARLLLEPRLEVRIRSLLAPTSASWSIH